VPKHSEELEAAAKAKTIDVSKIGDIKKDKLKHS